MRRPVSRIVFAYISIVIAVGAHAQAPPSPQAGAQATARVWVDATKTFRIEAELVKVVDGVAHLKRRDSGKVIEVPLDRLSADDIAFIRSSAAANPDGPQSPFLFADKLEAAAKRQRTAEKALGLYGVFMNDGRISAAEKEKAKTQYEHWQRAAEQSLIRVGAKWVTAEQARQMEAEESRLIDEAIQLYGASAYDRAEQRFREAMRLQPDSNRSNFRIGLIAALMERDAGRAEANFQACVARRISWREELSSAESANLSAALNNLAIAELRQGQYTSALGRWSQAIEVAPITPEIVQNLGRIVYLSRPDVRAALGKRATLSLSDSEQRRAEALFTRAGRGAAGVTFDPRTGWLYMGDIAERIVDKPDVAKKPQIIGDEDPFRNLRHASSGTGFVIAPGFVMTNAHVAEDASGFYLVEPGRLEVKLPATAHVVSTRPELDLAILHCPRLKAPPLDFAPKLPELAAEVRLVGFPLPGDLGLSLKVTGGLVSGLPPHAGMEGELKACREWLLYDAVINGGNSGGPACNKFGQVVAVNTAILMNRAQGGGYAAGIGSNLAIPFLEDNLKGIRAKWHSEETPALTWEQSVARVSASTVYVMNLQDPASLDLAGRFADARSRKGSWSAFEDPWCMACHGSGECKCRNRNCNNGKVDGYRTETVPLLNGGALSKKVRIDVACPACSGKGRIRCESCSNGIDAVFFIPK